MIRKLAPYVLVATAILLLFASSAAAWSDDIHDDVRYDVMAERQFEGTADKRPYVLEGRVYFSLRMANKMTDVLIGPKDFVDRSGFKVNAGDMVTVIGMPMLVNGKQIVIAREIRTVTSVFVVRDRNGQPMWKIGRPIQMDPERWDDPFVICGEILERRMQDIKT
jgi:hypothetical protein